MLLWWQAESGRLSQKARDRIAAASRVMVSPISCWQVARLVAKGRVELDRPTAKWVQDLFAAPGLGVAELTPGVATAAGELTGFHGDPADRILYATARASGTTLLSADRQLQTYAASDGTVHVTW